MSEYQAAFFIVPARIMNLPKISMAFVRIYETIFQFWNHGKDCYLTNEMIHQRTGISSHSTLMLAFAYFEKHGELKRVTKNGQRYLIQPERSIKEPQPVDKGVDKSTGGGSIDRLGGVDRSTHNKKNSNSKNINKSSYTKEDQKKDNEIKHEFASNMDQMANEKKHIDENQKNKRSPMPDSLKEIVQNIKLACSG